MEEKKFNNKLYYPKLRELEFIPFVYEGQKGFLLKDPWGYVEFPLFLSAQLVPLLSLMDGNHSLRDIQLAASRLFSRLVLLEEIENLVFSLDKNYFLESPNFELYKRKREEEFFALSVRPPAHAGKAYPAHPEELKSFLQSILAKGEKQNPQARALIAPHIDLKLGAKGFAQAYYKGVFPPDSRIIILGTGHFLETPFSILKKAFSTPLGTIELDTQSLLLIESALNDKIYKGQWAHKNEHSIEFQVLFLQYLLENRFQILPILFGNLEIPLENSLTEKLIFLLRKLLKEENVYLVAGVDFCHVGLKYGDPFPADNSIKKRVLQYDQKLLKKIIQLDAQGFFDLIVKERNRYRVCGFSPIYILLKILEGKDLSGKILHQEIVDFSPGSIVSLAALAFYEKRR